MKKKFDDLDFDEIPGKIKVINDDKSNRKKKKQSLFQGIASKRQKSNEWEDCLTRMEKHCMRSWICLHKVNPITNKLELTVHEIDKCNGETFLKWIKLVWPLCRDLGLEAEDFDSETNRANTLLNAIGLHNMLKFPSANSLIDKTKEKKPVKEKK